MVEAYKADFIEFLLERDVLKKGKFPLKSKRESPYFLKADAVDDGEGLLKLGQAYADAILAKLKPNDFDGIVGIPQKGHVFGPAIVVGLATRGANKKYSSWRAEAKTYGDATATGKEELYQQRQKELVIGAPIPNGSRQVLVDDVMTAGTAKEDAVKKLEYLAEKVDIPALAIAANRQEVDEFGDNAIEMFEQAYATEVVPIITATDIFDYLKEKERLSGSEQREFLKYFRAWGTPELRAAYLLFDKPLIECRTVIPACDIDSLERFEQIVRETADIEKIGGYKVGFQLGLTYGLPRVVEVAKKHAPNKPVIYDHQKAGTDIGDVEIARKFASTMTNAGVDAVIFFPQAGPVTQTAFTGEALQAGLGVIIGGHMTHKGYVESDRGYLSDDAPLNMYKRAARHGISNFVVPGNKPELVNGYRKLVEEYVGIKPTFYAPGFIAQGGKISEAGAAAGERFHAIVGRDLMNAKDIRAKALELTSQL